MRGREVGKEGKRGRSPVLNAQDGEPSPSPRDGSSVSTSGGRGALARGNYHYHHYGRCSLIGSCGRDEGWLCCLYCYTSLGPETRHALQLVYALTFSFFSPCSLCISRFQIDQNEYPTPTALYHTDNVWRQAGSPMGELTNN